jgi:hypothetical protein
MMGYCEAMEAAGAKVLAFQEFGSYQGEWYAKVEYNGEVGWVQGSYGSCSGCDAFEGEFGYTWYDDLSEDEKAEYQRRLADFGRTYLDTILPQEKQEELLNNVVEEDHWYYEDYQATLEFVKGNR